MSLIPTSSEVGIAVLGPGSSVGLTVKPLPGFVPPDAGDPLLCWPFARGDFSLPIREPASRVLRGSRARTTRPPSSSNRSVAGRTLLAEADSF